MKQNYFKLDGKKIYSQAVLIIRESGMEKEATFVYYDTGRKKYALKVGRQLTIMRDDMFNRCLISVTNKIDTSVQGPVLKKKKDSEINGLATGWLWYIVLMAMFSIFKQNIEIWIMLSFYFFWWRHDKIKKEGYYYEWKA